MQGFSLEISFLRCWESNLKTGKLTFDFGGRAGGFFRYVCFMGHLRHTHLVSVLVWSVFAAGSVVYLSNNSVEVTI